MLNEIEIDNLSYYSNERPELLPFIPRNIKNVLDVGCGTGMLGSAIKSKLGKKYDVVLSEI